MCSICCKGFQGVLLGGAFRGCTCLKCTNQVVVYQVSKKCANRTRTAPIKYNI